MLSIRVVYMFHLQMVTDVSIERQYCLLLEGQAIQELSSTLMTPVTIYQSTRLNIPEDLNLGHTTHNTK
jgi:hypothetical protein